MQYRSRTGKPLLLLACMGLALVTGACRSEPDDAAAPSGALEGAGADEAPNVEAAASDTEAGDDNGSQGAEDAAGDEAAPAVGFGDPGARDALSQAFGALAKQETWRMRQTIDAGNGETLVQVLEYRAPDRYRMSISEMELVIVGDEAWIKTGATWVPSPEMASMLGGLLEQIPNAELEGPGGLPMEAVEDLGKETLDGVETRKFAYQMNMPQVSVETLVWVDAATDLPIRQVTAGEMAGVSSEIQADFEYPEDLEIDAPSPASAESEAPAAP